MSSWTLNDLRRLDRQYAKKGIPFHQRPFMAAVEILGPRFVMGSGDNPEVERITNAYANMIPEVNTNWPGAGIGFIASVDQVRKLTLPIVFGEVSLQLWEVASFTSPEEWWNWCRQDRAIVGEVASSVTDIHDFTYGLNEIRHKIPKATNLWHMAQSNIEDVANTLPNLFNHDAIIQPICMIAELSMKASLVYNGAAPESFRGRGGHNLSSLARQMAEKLPHRDDLRVQAIVDALPPYVESRYKPAGLKRIQVVKLAVGVQFIAASSLRRLTTSDLVLQMASTPSPARDSHSPFNEFKDS